MDLLTAIKPESVNRDIIMSGRDEEEKKNNARYAISVARKIGATVFLTWEDIVEVKPKMIMTFCGCPMAVEQRGKGTHVMLGPGLNLARVPLNGRNFEYFGEDPATCPASKVFSVLKQFISAFAESKARFLRQQRRRAAEGGGRK